VIDNQRISFRAKEVHWKNLNAIAGMSIIPEHAMQGKDFNKINFEFPVVSGPYTLGTHKENIYLDMNKNYSWWNINNISSRNTYNFKTLRFMFFSERANAFESFKKGGLDLFPVYTARRWVKETDGEKFKKNWIIKQKIYNSHPLGFQGFAMNMRKPPFDSLLVRKAMCYLLDRKKMNKTLMYNQYFMQNSYFQDLYSPENPCPNPITPFDPDKAHKLLLKAGYKVNKKSGMMEKNGKALVFNFLSRNASTEKFLAIYKEDLKDAGVEMNISRKDWAAWMRDMDNFNFEMTWAAWGASLFKDPEGMWASKEADRVSGNNITGFKDKKVDELIEKQKTIFSISERNKICRAIDKAVFFNYPYALLWNTDYVRLLYWNKFGVPPTVLSKYGTEGSANYLWWEDEDQVADLMDAEAEKSPMPSMPSIIRFYEAFRPDIMGGIN